MVFKYVQENRAGTAVPTNILFFNLSVFSLVVPGTAVPTNILFFNLSVFSLVVPALELVLVPTPFLGLVRNSLGPRRHAGLIRSRQIECAVWMLRLAGLMGDCNVWRRKK
jgi:hypothetical protein